MKDKTLEDLREICYFIEQEGLSFLLEMKADINREKLVQLQAEMVDYCPFRFVQGRYEDTAKQDSSLWRYIVIDHEGNTQKNPLTTQSELLNMFPEINPRFFHNFGITELVIRQANGTQLILKKVR